MNQWQKKILRMRLKPTYPGSVWRQFLSEVWWIPFEVDRTSSIYPYMLHRPYKVSGQFWMPILVHFSMPIDMGNENNVPQSKFLHKNSDYHMILSVIFNKIRLPGWKIFPWSTADQVPPNSCFATQTANDTLWIYGVLWYGNLNDPDRGMEYYEMELSRIGGI